MAKLVAKLPRLGVDIRDIWPYNEPMQKRNTQTAIKRIFRICKVCKHRSTRDYTVETGEFLWARGWCPYIEQYRMDGDIRITLADDCNARCAGCGAYASDGYHATYTLRSLKHVKIDADHECDDRCRRATSDHCTCACGGKNHGIAHLEYA